MGGTSWGFHIIVPEKRFPSRRYLYFPDKMNCTKHIRNIVQSSNLRFSSTFTLAIDVKMGQFFTNRLHGDWLGVALQEDLNNLTMHNVQNFHHLRLRWGTWQTVVPSVRAALNPSPLSLRWSEVLGHRCLRVPSSDPSFDIEWSSTTTENQEIIKMSKPSHLEIFIGLVQPFLQDAWSRAMCSNSCLSCCICECSRECSQCRIFDAFPHLKSLLPEVDTLNCRQVRRNLFLHFSFCVTYSVNVDVNFRFVVDCKMPDQVFAKKPQALFFAAVLCTLFFFWRNVGRALLPLSLG